MAKKGKPAVYCKKCGAVANSTKKNLDGTNCFRSGCDGVMEIR